MVAGGPLITSINGDIDKSMEKEKQIFVETDEKEQIVRHKIGEEKEIVRTNLEQENQQKTWNEGTIVRGVVGITPVKQPALIISEGWPSWLIVMKSLGYDKINIYEENTKYAGAYFGYIKGLDIIYNKEELHNIEFGDTFISG